MQEPSAPLISRARLSLDRNLRPVRAWWDVAPDNLKGSVFLMLSYLAFGAMVAGIKALGAGVPILQMLFIRQIIMMILLMPLFLPDIHGALRTSHLGLQAIRGIVTLGSMFFGFTAIQHIPLADATALGFSQILFVTALAVVILKEKVGVFRWTATGIGFLGVLIMLRPGQNGFEIYALFAVIGALFASLSTITVRMLSSGERTATILLYQAIVLLVALIVPTFVGWVTPSPHEWALLLLIGVSGTFGQLSVTRGYQIGEAAALAPLDFLRLLVNTGLGMMIFGEFPDAITLAGAALVVGSTIAVLWRNARKGRPADGAPKPEI